jgi:hypothetical protein
MTGWAFFHQLANRAFIMANQCSRESTKKQGTHDITENTGSQPFTAEFFRDPIEDYVVEI